MLFALRIAPHFLQFVKFACFGLHNMHNDIYEVDQNPLATVLTFSSVWCFIDRLLSMCFYEIGDCLNLRGAAGFTDDEKICYSFRYLSQIE